MDTDRGKVQRQAAAQLHAPLCRLDELRHIGMAGVEGGVGVDDADDGTREGILAVSEGLDEDLAQEEGKVRVAVVDETLAHATKGLYGAIEVIVGQVRGDGIMFGIDRGLAVEVHLVHRVRDWGVLHNTWSTGLEVVTKGGYIP